MRTSKQTRPRRRLQVERERLNRSRAEIAYLAACSESQIAKLENGTRRGSSSLRTRLSRVLGVPPHELLAEVADDGVIA